jgi:hypothetical protein
MSQTVTQITHANKTITILDYTYCPKTELIKRVEEVKAWMLKQPKDSLLTLSDVSGQKFDKETLEAFKKLALHNKPFVKAGAIIGIEGLQKIAYNTIMAFSSRNMPAFTTREEAMDWLVKQ